MVRIIINGVNFLYRLLLKLLFFNDYKEFNRHRFNEFQRIKEFLPVNQDFDLGEENLKRLMKEWQTLTETSFDRHQSQNFYQSWQGSRGYLNIIVNGYDQFRRFEVFLCLKKYWRPQYVVADLGAGTAAFYWDLVAPSQKLYLVDFENEAYRYVKFKTQRDQKRAVTQLTPQELEQIPPGSIDFLLCIDMLEHIPNPSAFLRDHIMRILRPGGLLLLQAPFGGGIPEHLDEAEKDWVQSGGRKDLKTSFHLIKWVHHLVPLKFPCVSGLYLFQAAQ